MSGKHPAAMTQVLPLSQRRIETGANSEVAPGGGGTPRGSTSPVCSEDRAGGPAHQVMLSARESGEISPASRPENSPR